MSKVKIQGNASGTGVVTLTAPNTNTDRTITLPDGDISLGVGIDDNATSNAITINASEVVMIGKSTYSSAEVGTMIDTRLFQTSDGTPTTYLNRLTTDGDIAVFRKDGTTVGSLASDSGAHLIIKGAGNNAALLFNHANSRIEPYSNSVTDLGRPNAKFKDLHLSGNVVIGTSGKGIDFSAATPDGTGTTGSEVLDDYEEGTWTPNLRDSSGNSVGQSGQSGHYTKIGNLVYCIFAIQVNSVSGAGNALQIQALPFTAEDVTEGSGEPSYGALTFANNLTSRDYGAGIILRVNNASDYIECKYTPGGATTTMGGTNWNTSDISASTYMAGSFTYRV